MTEIYNKHYITVDEKSRITGGWSDGPRRDRYTSGAILLTEKGSYQFRLYPGGEENPPLYEPDDGIPLYRWDGLQVIARTEEEIEADRAALPIPPEAEAELSDAELAYAIKEGVDSL